MSATHIRDQGIAGGGVCDFTPQPIRRRPFAHVVKDNFIDQETYRVLKASYPTGPVAPELPRFASYWGDSEYDRRLAENPAWRALFDSFHSQRFVDYCIEHFGDDLARGGCRVDLAKARYVPYLEDRTDKKLLEIRKVELEPHDLWVRMDIYQGDLGYFQPVHLDAPRRLVSMLVYFCDHDETGIKGGDLFLHPGQHKTWWPRPIKVPFRNNRMAMFACGHRSWHSVPAITAMRRRRDYLQVLLSSSVAAFA